jgi:hypothetical protein
MASSVVFLRSEQVSYGISFQAEAGRRDGTLETEWTYQITNRRQSSLVRPP